MMRRLLISDPQLLQLIESLEIVATPVGWDISYAINANLILEHPGLRRHDADVDALNRFVRIPRALWNVDPAIDELPARLPIKIDPLLPAPRDARRISLH